MNIFTPLFSCCLSFYFPTMTSQSPRHEPCDFSTYIVVELLASVSVTGNYQLSCSFDRQKQNSKNNTSINYNCLLLWVCQYIYLTIVSSVRSVLIIVNYAGTIAIETPILWINNNTILVSSSFVFSKTPQLEHFLFSKEICCYQKAIFYIFVKI